MMRWNQIGFKICLAVFLATGTQILGDSLGTGGVGGTIRDETGGLVAGARVVLTERGKGLTRECLSDSTGSFLFPSVIAGLYSVRVEKTGFKTQKVDELNVEVGELASIPIALVVGDLSTVITISSPSSTELDSESNTLGSVVDSQRVQALPLNGRNFLQLALLVGGAGDIGPITNAFVAFSIGPPSRQIVLPATLPYSTSYSLNGINIEGSRSGELAIGLSVAAIDQFRVQESFLMPDQGTGAAAVNVVTRSGSNQFHGEAFEFLRNYDLDARSFFAPSAEDLKRNQFGFAVGGPLWRDRFWFHGFYEGTRQVSAFTAAGYSPTRAMFGGNFAGTGKTIYDPNSFDPDSGTRQPFPNDAIPPNRINPVSTALLKYYLPGSSLAELPSNVFGNPKDTLTDDQGGLRIDVALASRQQLFVQLFKQSTPVDDRGLYPLGGTLYSNGSSLAMLQHTWSLSRRAVNTLRIGFFRAIANGGNEAQTPTLSSIGIVNTFSDYGITKVNLQGYSFFGNSQGLVGNRDNTWEIDEQLNYAHGAHNLAFGSGIRYRRGWHENSNGGALGSLVFQSAFTAQLTRNAQGQFAPLANTGDSFADFLLGLPVSGNASGLPVVQYRGTQVNSFAQDTWKITPGLTLNYGISWFVETPPDPQGWARSAVHGFDQTTGLLTFAALGQVSPKVISTDWNNISPRFGFAWKPAALKSTVIRAGAGFYYSEMPWFLAQWPLIAGPPYGGATSFTNSLSNPIPAYTLGQNVFPPAPVGAVTTSTAANVPAGSIVSGLDPAFRTAYVSQWNLSVQHALSRNDSLELSYLGSSGHRLPVINDLSQCQPTPSLFCDPAAKAWPRYALVFWATSAGNSSYEGGIARYHRRAGSGLSFQFEYTLSKALTDAWQYTANPQIQITSCRACDKGPAYSDVRSRAVASLVWEIPYRRNRFEWIAGGWSVTAITTFATGQPILLTGPNQTGTLVLNHLPNRICNGNSDQLSGNIRNNGFLWFNPACFPVPSAGYFGNSGPTVLNGPGINNWDLGVERIVPLKESVKLRLRGEFFNAWNRAQFMQPDGNSGDGPNFGRISAARPGRLIQVAAKLAW